VFSKKYWAEESASEHFSAYALRDSIRRDFRDENDEELSRSNNEKRASPATALPGLRDRCLKERILHSLH
jgi:hypothetical protein